MNRILRQARKSGNARDAALLELLADTGLRASEVAGLTIADLELNDRSGWVTVRAAKGKGKNSGGCRSTRGRGGYWRSILEKDN